jgi:hypothetical protein
MAVMMYGPAIRNALASKNLTKMKSAAAQARQLIAQQGDLHAALIKLEDAIAKMESKPAAKKAAKKK